LAATPLFAQASAPIVLPRYRVQDIDTQDDWIRAEMMFEILNQSTERKS
jgi:N-acylneuraminate cytidylyltransferase